MNPPKFKLGDTVTAHANGTSVKGAVTAVFASTGIVVPTTSYFVNGTGPFPEPHVKPAA